MAELRLGPVVVRLVAADAEVERLRSTAGSFLGPAVAPCEPVASEFHFCVGPPEGVELQHRGVREGIHRPLGSRGLAFWDGEFTVGLRLALARLFPPPDWLLCHAAALRYPGGTVVAVGESGAGKSTLATFAGGELLSDELVLIDVVGRVAWGTPVRSSCRRPPSPASGPLRAIVTLRHAATASLEPIAPAKLLPAVMASLAATPGTSLADQLDASIRLVERVPGFELSFAPDASVAAVLESLCHD